MQIKPTGAGAASGTGPGRARESQARTPADPESRVAPRDGRASSSDRIEISDAARKLLETGSPEDSASGPIDPRRARAVLDRLGNGFYQQAEVKNEVLRRIAAELGIASE